MEAQIKSLIEHAHAECVAVALHDLGSGRGLQVGADQSFHPASTMKVPVMMEVYHQAAQGKLALDECIPLINEFISIADGRPFSVYPAKSKPFALAVMTRGISPVADAHALVAAISRACYAGLAAGPSGAHSHG